MIIVMLTAKELADLTVAMQDQPSQKVTCSSEAILKAIRGMQKECEESTQSERQARPPEGYGQTLA